MDNRVAWGEVSGLKDLGKAMQDLSGDIALKVSKSATKAAAKVVQLEVQRRVPVSKKPHKVGKKIVEPGNLKKNIRVRKKKISKFTSRYDVTWGRDAFYGNILEFGLGKLKRAYPHMRPGFEASKQEALETMKKTLAKRIKSARKKVGL